VSFTKLVQGEFSERSQIEIVVSVLQADGSVKSAAFNAITLALMNAGTLLY